ncbi:MAG TPA: preprotein translocase subunit YajC [Desulfomicrobiaceae bacterium]|jgi:preprotein translocase subunit YajC|nr:preprotein translocase subunit YajC [Desulfomicrobiaceae bacterium]
MFFENLAYAMGQTGGAAGQQGNPIAAFMPLIIMFAIFYFLLIRPQQKKQKEHKATLANLKRGDRIITGGGLYGRILEVKEDILTLDLGNDVQVQINRSFVSGLAEPKAQEPKKEKGKKK